MKDTIDDVKDGNRDLFERHMRLRWQPASLADLSERLRTLTQDLRGYNERAAAFDAGYRQALADVEHVLSYTERRARQRLLGERRAWVLRSIPVVRKVLRVVRQRSPYAECAFEGRPSMPVRRRLWL